MLNTTETEELEAYRSLLEEYETVSTVSNHVQWGRTNFERLITSWQRDVKQLLSDLIKSELSSED